ncbi:MAG: ATP-binding cassette domain-containing protein [Prevotellaceae bacterium]|jgi:ABC-2 type transport system ATP-binding protein|nr:ATP-binding cassette domain-containing protein [Prevotellaceae bacterium]
MILRTENIVKQYASHLALDDVSIEVPQASIYGLLGPNGAGKTTLIRIINQITAPDSGKVFFDGHELCKNDVYSIGYLPEERGLYKKMKVGEQAMYFARLKGLSKNDAEKCLRTWFEKFEILAWWNKKVEELSKGMAQKVQFIVTILHKPKLLIFDEPFSGFDPINVNLLKTEILNLKKEGSTIIFSTHNMSSVEETCDYITLINKSKNVLSGQIDEIRHNYGDNIFEIDYLGETEKLKENLGENYRILNDGEQKFFRKIIIKATAKESGNALLARIIKDVEIVNFNQIIPSMNDIFIKLVEADK